MTKLIFRIVLVAALSSAAVTTLAAPALAGGRNSSLQGSLPGGR